MFLSYQPTTPSLQVQIPVLHATLTTPYMQTAHLKSILMSLLQVYLYAHEHRDLLTSWSWEKTGVNEFSSMKQKLTFLPFVLFNRVRVKKGAPYLKILPTAAAWQIFHNQSVFCTGRRTVLISSASSITISTFRRWQADSSTSTREMEHSLYTPRQKRSAPYVCKSIKNSPTR